MSASWPPPGAARVGRADNRPLVFAAKYPDDSLEYTLPLGLVVQPTDDVARAISIACAPSGDGELALFDPVVDADAIWVRVAGGQPGRVYTLKYLATLTSGHVRQVIANLTVERVLPTDQPPASPSEAFGTPVRWTPGSGLATNEAIA